MLSPNADDAGVWIHQNAWFNVGEFDKGMTQVYSLNDTTNGVYVFVISGSVLIDGNVLQPCDGLGTTRAEQLTMDVITNAQVLVMDLPVN